MKNDKELDSYPPLSHTRTRAHILPISLPLCLLNVWMICLSCTKLSLCRLPSFQTFMWRGNHGAEVHTVTQHLEVALHPPRYLLHMFIICNCIHGLRCKSKLLLFVDTISITCLSVLEGRSLFSFSSLHKGLYRFESPFSQDCNNV